MRNKWFRFLLPLAIFAVAAFLLRDKMPFLAEGYDRVKQANPVAIILAVLTVLLSIQSMALVMRDLLNYGGAKVRLREASELTLISNSWSATFPGGPAISTVYQFHTMRTWGISPALISWFIAVSGVLSSIWLLALGIFAAIFLEASFHLWRILTIFVLLSLVIILLFAAINNTRTTAKVFTSTLRGVNKLLRANPERGVATLHKHVMQLSSVKMNGRQFTKVAVLSLLNWVFDVISMACCIWAVTGVIPGVDRQGEIPSILGVTLAFITTKLVGSAQITPAGVGPVEAAMTTSLVAAGMTASTAFGAVFIYRIFSFALVTLIGWIAYTISVWRGGARVLGTHVSHADDLPLSERRFKK